ncbi:MULTISPECIES: acetyl-CoA carboxylase biotin carboxylase subunit [Lysinibacillus]|jgi:acetyl-CoA carboxylase biotin carboxylase subunit|uniref:biotin carboxylase n=1 Tax=Lysinibacillus fusiformis TaxID=28031 RepID=A0A2I0V695_9BACI|nr:MULTISPECIES: acetyl-CoA carboxylase biotin carboxylase subunit [Lysinibacillus]KUF35942.1 biotin carboxylase [Lysinibacillus sp. F5]MEE3807721.1 acetyl-CoA carboxylase biotin carboxylase subunit [Lysinibacillus fusiformis]PKU53815.1 acetyl-CoA carboxylase biotin carboxylase subunit [Lysinibacillus fusiformis]SCY51624.1 acetyl-CoA carboxylase, biotin carboxylase subunit [Lysinibacillus sp. SG9]SDB22557.1 acetyl-CoA carboxylase, biotin carboxylase subunit [Lysinibacillus sp. TC-37]
MFNKVLIANRGEIARRVIRTCKRLNIHTVAIYSEADVDSLHVKDADEAYCVGKPPVAQSYLNIDRILEIAKESGAEAVHPGYGLLSENVNFAKRCTEAGLVFIGPSAEVIASMGSKLEARKTMKAAGVPIVEGVEAPVKDVAEATEIAERLGYPIMLKASAGGGGIGMQLVDNAEELAKAFEGNQKRAQSFFGDGTMYMERFIANPHHVEVQIIADHQGNIVPLFERECSIQRRNQKVVEEAPSPFISQETRDKMLEASVKAVRHIGYVNAGTIEYLVDKDQNFYFLEMNTRLQVEHPVTEEITKLDLVEEQLKIAAKLPLSFTRESIAKDGHAIEVRIYAENPSTFFPSPGTITVLELPTGEGVRHECGVETGSAVTPFYDPMISKLVVWGETREIACERLIQALKAYKVEGIQTNIPMLLKTVTHEQFLKGNTTTKFVEQYYLPQLAETK